jgi:hypothetical protein
MSRKQYENKIIELAINADPTPQLNDAGRDGWKLVAVTTYDFFACHYLRRELEGGPLPQDED